MNLKMKAFVPFALSLSLLFCSQAWAGGITVDHVFLTLTLERSYTNITACVKEINESWNQYQTTWNHMPSISPGNLDCVEINDTSYPYEVQFNISKSRGQYWDDNPDKFYGLACLNDGQTSADEWYVFFSRESDYQSPVLEIWFHRPGDPTQWYITYEPSKDTYIDQQYPNEANPTSHDLFAGYHVGYGMWIALMAFDTFIAVEEPFQVGSEVPEAYALFQNYPNPFNSETAIRFQIPQTGLVNLYVYNVTGQLVRKLTDGQLEAGSYEVRWDGRDDMDLEVASGLYFCWLRAGEFVKTVKMMFVK